MNTARLFLALTGLLYAGLAVWCSVDPATTSRKVGFELRPGSGQSEFLTVYGGLEMGLALFFLSPLLVPSWERPALMGCLLLHGSLVAFRTAGFFMFPAVEPMTWRLAAGEWAIFIAAAAIWLLRGASGTAS